MPHALHSQSNFLLSKHVLHFNPLMRTNTVFQNYDFVSKFPSIVSSLSLSVRTHTQKRVICAKKSKRRPGSQKSRKFMLQLLSILASNLNILPQPLDLVIQEFNSGEGGGLGFWKGYGGGGGGFGWWRRRKKGTLWFIMLLVISSSLFLLNGRELNENVICGALGLSSFGAVFVKGFKRNVKNWFFGLCCFGALVGLGWNRQKAMKWVDESRICSPMVEIFAGGKRNGRRAM